MKYEKGVVLGRVYKEAYTNTWISMDQYYDGQSYKCCMPTTHTDFYPAKFLLTFQCAHGDIFEIDNSAVFMKVVEFDTVVISYYELLNNKGEVKDYDFIDANKTKKEF
jgi:hypothetical protein